VAFAPSDRTYNMQRIVLKMQSVRSRDLDLVEMMEVVDLGTPLSDFPSESSKPRHQLA
jgi:hypothetical protein